MRRTFLKMIYIGRRQHYSEVKEVKNIRGRKRHVWYPAQHDDHIYKFAGHDNHICNFAGTPLGRLSLS